jgi:hypothetical protein
MSVSSEQMALALENARRSLSDIGTMLASLNASPSTVTPPVVQGIEHQATSPVPTRQVLTSLDQFEIRQQLRKRSTPELVQMFYEQAGQSNTGIPLGVWLNAGGQARSERFGGIGRELDPMVQKALDTAGASALIRQDLEPILYELYIREFPAFDRVTREPANGLTHTYQQITSFGDAQFMAELGTVTDDKSTYHRETTNIAIIATRRGVSLKSQFATLQSGSGFNPEALELQGGLRSISFRMQNQLFSGHSTDSGGTADNELGLFDENAFTGLRSILNTARAKNVDPTASTPENMRRAVNKACIEVMQNAGRVSMTWWNPLAKEEVDNQQDQNVRYMNELVDVSVGVVTNAINTVFGKTPLGVVPGNAISPYWTDNGGSDGETRQYVRDAYLLDESIISFPYLGSEGPTVLDIPMGISGQLTHLFIIFGMWGLAVKAPTFCNKVRVKVAAGDTPEDDS